MSLHGSWFEVDKTGLAKLLRRKGLSFVLFELLQNAWDTNATEVAVILERAGRGLARLRVEDNDPNGFKFLNHSFTMFADSDKKSDPTKRGRFNLGEKQVLAVCEEAMLSSTTGTVFFRQDPVSHELTREVTRGRRPFGSAFEATIKMTIAEMDEILAAAKLLHPPIPTLLNGEALPMVSTMHEFEGTLATEIGDAEGVLRRSARKTTIRIYPKTEDGIAYLYEMGIPVVETDFPWSVDVGQKIPLNTDRDNVTPTYRKALGVLVVNEMHTKLTSDQASSPIVQEALTSPDVAPEAVNSVLTQQYGDKRVVFDPSDLEANHHAAAKGYVVIHGGAFSRDAWVNIREAKAATPAGQIFPTPELYDPEGDPARIIPEAEWTPGMRAVADLCIDMAERLMGVHLRVIMEKERKQKYLANYGARTLTFNAPRLGLKWFDLKANLVKILDLMIHEFCHEYASSHLDSKFNEKATKLGAEIAVLALTRPELFQGK